MQVFIRGQKWIALRKFPTNAVPSTDTNLIINVMAVMCGLALVVLACMATSGLDMSPGFF